MDSSTLKNIISHIEIHNFEEVALRVFQFQYQNNPIYQKWVDLLHIDPANVNSVHSIPFLPIASFKNHKVSSCAENEKEIFTSSGTTGTTPSQHYVYDKTFYLDIATNIFINNYGPVEDYSILALLPSYLERTGSSLIAMIDHFIANSQNIESGFFLYNHQELYDTLVRQKVRNQKTILFGVSFALLDFLENFQIEFPNLIVIETGGMKGRKKEISRSELHNLISEGFGIRNVHSEYGMTELFSQGYSQSNEIFYPGKTMRVYTKEITDPFSNSPKGKNGIINIIDLANVDSCAFIETEDIGILHKNGGFEILGRLDNSELRGCNLMVSDL